MSNITLPTQKSAIANLVDIYGELNTQKFDGKYAIAYRFTEGAEPKVSQEILIKIDARTQKISYVKANPFHEGRRYKLYRLINVIPDFESDEWINANSEKPLNLDKIIFVDFENNVYKGFFYEGVYYTYNDWGLDDLKAAKLFLQKSEKLHEIDAKFIKFWQKHYEVKFHV